MSKNNPLRSMTPKNKNYKLYKAKKQWITACATFMLAFGATAVVNASVQADTTTPTTTQADSDSVTSISEPAQTQSSVVETAQNTDETKKTVVDDTTKTSEQKITTAQNTESSNSNSSTSKTNNEENKNALLTLDVETTADTNQVATTQAAATTTNGGYDSATWGTLDTSKWTGQNTTFNGSNYYQLTGYTGDQTHIIVPNEADFEQAGKSTNNLQVSISNDLIKSWQNATTIAFSKTDDKKIKLASTNLNGTFQKNTILTNLDTNSLDTSSATSMQNTFSGATKLASLTGVSDWDVSNVTNMSLLFQNATGLTSLTGLENWDVQKVTNMTRIFNNVNKVTDLSPLSNWKTDSLQKLNTAFANNSFTNLQGLENWNVSHVTDMGVIFMNDYYLTDISALANWDTSNVTDLNQAFNVNQALTSLHGLENWNTSKVTNLYATFANEGSLVDASAIANWNTSNVTNMSVLFAGSSAQYVDLSNWDFSKVTSASNVINNTQSVVYLGNNSTLTANKLNTLGIANGGFTQPIILASGNLYTLLSNKNNNTHNITINNADSGQSTTISFPVVYDAAGASNMTDAINSYKDMIDQKLEDYVTEHNYVLKRVSTDPVDDVTGHNNHLVNYATATYQVVTIPVDQKKNLQIQDKTTYKGKTLTAKDLVTNVADFPAGTTFKFADNSEPNWNQVGTYNVKVIATYPVSVNGQQYTAVTAPATANVTVTQQMQFTITYWDDTENKQIVQFDIKNPGNGGYSNDLKFPEGVNPGTYQSVGVSEVPAGVTFNGSYNIPFTKPDCNWTIPNYKWTSEAAPSLFDANIVIHLIHRTQNVTDTDPKAQETRTVTVNYVKTKVNEDGTYTEDGNAFTSAVLDVYYTRQATKDLATGDITYGPWQWNTKKGDSNTPGYRVVSGTWTNLPQEWASVTADVPILTGYTAYTGGPASNTDKIPANQFVFPSWNGSTTDVSKDSTAYTTAASFYEAQPVHTIFYVPNKTETRTVTAKFMIAGGDKDGQSFAPDAQIQVFYDQTGTIDPTTNKVVYSGKWQWDKSKGDTANLGFHVISGNWNFENGGQFTVTPPNGGSDYVIANINSTGTYTTINFANPNYNSNTVFTTNNASQWYARNELTTYYVPKSLVEKTINRVINITMPNNPGTPSITQTTTQSATITRPVKVNADDSGVVFDGFSGSGWTTGEWPRYNTIPSITPYTRIIKQIVTNPDGTTTETTLNIIYPRPIPSQKVTVDTLPTVINVTFTATATATLSGENQSTYTGNQITVNDLNNGDGDAPIMAVIIGPINVTPSLEAGWVEFSSDNGKTWSLDMPTNVGTYKLRWSDQGKEAIIQQCGNNSTKWTDADGNSTFTGTATYIITPASATCTLSNQTSGNYTKVYDAQPTTSIDPSKFKFTTYFDNREVVLNTTGLTSDSYEWVDASGNPISNPENVGTYYVKLKDSALATLQKDNPNFTLTNTGLAVYTITQAQADGVLGGANSRLYNGQTITTAEVNSNGQIRVTVNFPGVTDANKTYILKDGDYTWNSGSAPSNVGSYTITLTPTGISNIEKYILSLAGYGQNNTSNVVFADNAFTGSANYDIDKAQATATIGGNYERPYNGQVIQGTTVYGKITWTAHDTTNDVDFTLNHDLSANDYAWYTKSGDQYVKFEGRPVNVGTYYLILNKDYVDKLNKENPNYNFTDINGAFTYVINKATATLNISGNQSNEYNGQPVTIDYKNFPLSITTNNGVTIDLPENVNLSADDIVITNTAGEVVSQPTTIGTYTISLTDNGLKKFESQTDNYNWNKAGFGTLSITRNANVSVALSGNENIVYTGSTAVIDPANFKIELGNGLTYQLQAGDLQFVNTAVGANTNVGTYKVELSDQGRANIAQVQADNYGYDFSKAGFGTVTITKAIPSASFRGTAEKIYDGTPINGYTPIVTITAPGNNSLTLTTGDFEWVKDGKTYTTAPSDVGTYTVQLTQTGINKVKAVNANNLDWSNVQVTGSGTYTIKPANALITLPNTSTQTITWTGKPATINPADFIPEITTNNPNEGTITLPSTLQLTASDYEFLQDGKVISAPSEIGTYQVRLTQAGWQKVQDSITGNTNYAWNYQGEGNYHIEKATATITLEGSGSTIYTGNPVVIPNTNGVVNGISVELSNGQTYSLQPEDLEFVDSQGNQVAVPTNAGSYKVKLTNTALGQIRNLESNHYNYTYNNDAVAFTVEKATAEVGVIGTQNSTYTGKVVDLSTGNFQVVIITNNGQPLNYNLQAGDLMTTVPAPTDAANYDVYLSDQGKKHLEAINSNYDWTFTNTPALLSITPAELTVGIVGTASSVYDGNPVKITNQDQMKDLKLRWGGYDSAPDGVKFTLQPSDVVINGGADAIETGKYSITLSAAAIKRLNQENPNYDITQSTKDLAQYIIYARKGRITLSGTQTTPYGRQVVIDPTKFTIALTDTMNGKDILYPTPLSVGDLQFKDTQYSDNNLPTQVGNYELVPTQKLYNALKEYYPDYDFGDSKSEEFAATDGTIGNENSDITSDSDNTDVDKQHTKGANYIITPVDAYISLNGSESVRYTGEDQPIDYSKYSVSISGLVNRDNYNYTLQDGDLEFVGTTPNEVGNYQVKLTKQALENIRKLNSLDYNWLLSDDANTAPFDVIQMPVTITVSDKATVPTIIYGEATTLNQNDYTISVKTADGEILDYTPAAGDLQFENGTPTSVGTFEVILSNQGLQNIEKHFGTKNYTYTSTGNGSFIIKKASAGIRIVSNGSDSMVYNGESPNLNVDNYKLEITTNNGQVINIPLAAGDLVFSAGSNPVDAGSYNVTLSQNALNKVKQDHPNYDWSNPVAGTYTITKASADVTTSGSYEVLYNGQTPVINVDKITNNIATNNGVNLMAPTLSANDYEWVDETGKVIGKPINVGTYYLKLKDSSQSKIATNNNYIWNFSGLASVTISKANATIGFNGNQETPYTGSAVTLDPDKFEVKLSNGQTYNLTDKDIQVVGNPVNVGTYQVELSQTGIDAIKAADSNYNYSYDGSQGLLVIIPAKTNATISGSQTTQDLELDPHNYSVVVVLNGQQQTITGLTASDFVFSKDGHPAQLTEAGTYDVELSGDVINKIRHENPNYNIDFSSTAIFTLGNSSQTINYVDADNNVISSVNIDGHIKGTKLPFTPEIPVGWVASDPSDVPTEIIVDNGTTLIMIKHGTTNVDHNNPVPEGEKTPTGKEIDGAHENELNQAITRTINVINPDGTKSTEVQTAKIYRDASYDDVTGQVTYGEWLTANWKEFIPAEVKGYTASEEVIPAVEVKNGQKDETIEVTYTANEQSGIISYQDKEGNEISTSPLSGKTGEAVAVKPEIPAGWQLVPSQEVPKTVTATAEGIPTVVIQVEHGTTIVTPETPTTDIPTGKVPGNPSKNYPTMEQLTVTPTRTINIKYPSGEEQSIPQKVTFTRTAIFDEVTGEIKYTAWRSQGSLQWANYQPVTVTGYVPSQKIVSAMTVNADTPNETVNITYDKVPVPQEGQEIISYQDANDQIINTQIITGEENSDVSFKPEVPTNWQVVGKLPQSVKITGGTTVIVIEPATTPIQERKVVKRIIIEHLPSGDKQTVQKVVLTGIGTKNLVTGEVIDIKWENSKFVAFTPETVAGYTPSQGIIAAQTVTGTTTDETIDITYTPDEQTGFIIYRDENGSDISQTALQGKTDETVVVNLAVPAGWQLVPGQSIPTTVIANDEDIPDVVVLIEHQVTIVKPGEEAPTGKVPGNPSTTYEKMESLTKEVIRLITIKLPDGQRRVITQTVKFIRTATFDAVTGKVTYSSWQANGSTEWPTYSVPEIDGYIASQTIVPTEMVVPSDQNKNIEIEYAKDNRPSEPIKPVMPITPEQPTNPSQPVTPIQPTEPSVPTKSIVPTSNGDKQVTDDQPKNKPVERVIQHVTNQHFASRRLVQIPIKGKSKANVLPQTGNDQNNNSLFGFAFATLAGIFGLAGMQKKKREK
ncbi:MBG domain-containing protein [Limosilactobacillus balticus]|uniref:BspA family leucine-rich repeat surface protein n=1 Tax=Limosilactobacillus balticus TaxID=2759747 RepID=A0ABS8RDY1_9LACO|nr:MBG domain-containing protein [Limosilactobacillus balticus]MBB1128210.1 BspA family leucine-rich repeat surface protein [Limosilactobacillus balticus]MCD7137860.1 BspA family leucine-rich repeat surface protein [Limosilactobacillus balticus]